MHAMVCLGRSDENSIEFLPILCDLPRLSSGPHLAHKEFLPSEPSLCVFNIHDPEHLSHRILTEAEIVNKSGI